MRPIFLIGFMGSGKSTLGRLVSKAAEIDFIDLDNYIEARFSKVYPISLPKVERMVFAT